MARVWFPPSILLVNDVPDEREMYARTLRAAGYRAITAENSAVAYQIATRRPPDIVVTDVRITGSISGLELTRRLRTNHRTQAAGIIVLTTVSRPQDADVALKAGANRFLEKPVSAPILRAEIARLLTGSRELFAESCDRRHGAHAAGAPRHDGARIAARLTNPRVCPWCHSNVIYRARWPGLTFDSASGTVDRERLRYAAGWFCTNPTCDYRRLSDDSGDVSSDSSVGRRS
jgi:CheY-like chemotaxis protein